MLSIIIPAFCEAENLPKLMEILFRVLHGQDCDFEVIVVNDGSTDNTEQVLYKLTAHHPELRVINFRRNFGQTAAIMAGFDHAKGSILIPMDADLQNDPNDIPRLVAALEDGYDVVSGWRKDRKDDRFLKVLPSKIANVFASWITGVNLSDFGCTLKAYRQDLLADIRLYGEMHRFIPALVAWRGARVKELEVTHHPRNAGQSNYGLGRIFKVVADLLVIKFLTGYATKPVYVFAMIGSILLLLSVSTISYAGYLKFAKQIAMIHTPLPTFSAMCFISALLCFLMGLLAELIVRVYFESQHKRTYVVKSKVNLEPDDNCVG